MNYNDRSMAIRITRQREKSLTFSVARWNVTIRVFGIPG
jgi:hypothetical protein